MEAYLDTNFIDLAAGNTKGSAEGFSKAVTVWINKPHVVNRRLCGSKLTHFSVSKISDFGSDTLKKVSEIVLGHISVESRSHVEEHTESSDVVEVDGLSEYEEDDIILIIRELLQKQPERNKTITELITYEKGCEKVTFYPLYIPSTHKEDNTEFRERLVSLSEVTYQFQYIPNSQRIQLRVNSTDFSTDSARKTSLTWLKDQLLKKITNWSGEPELKTSLTSLKLVPLQEYTTLYQQLKQKYGFHFVRIWPEKTDPQKFVYEDVAIATYLLVLWKHDREKKGLSEKQSFVDLGCGNGLLVNILASEGHPGYGIDIRKRHIWDIYGPQTDLREMSITPSADSLFPDCDWIIGNHSDELTPWIPVIAARSSYTCNYFVLPCCHYDFNNKFSHTCPGTSQYRTYLDFVKQVGDQCGFIVEEDMLRIPSTKRVCFIGSSRSYTMSEEAAIDQQRTDFITSRCNKQTDISHNPKHTINNNSNSNHGSEGVKRTFDSNEKCLDTDSVGFEEVTGSISSSGKVWASDFQPRSREEILRNCTTVRSETKDHVIKTVFNKLMNFDSCDAIELPDGTKWKKGGCMSIAEVVQLFDKTLLQELKSNCGGLQTLLRNSSHIFQVSGGMVQLRDFTLDDPWMRNKKRKTTKSNENIKTVLCWFFDNHPDGCPKPSSDCKFAHGQEELKSKTKSVI